MKRSLLKIIVSAVLMLTIIASVAALAGCGNQKITIPDVVGMTKADAEKAITDAGLTMEVQRENFSDKIAEGSIISMITKAGESIDKGSVVKVVASLGEGVTVPNLGVLTEREATNLVTKVGLKPVVVEEFSNDVEAGNVISYTDAGQIIKAGSEVTITVSKGPEA